MPLIPIIGGELDNLDFDKANESRLQNVDAALPYKRSAYKTARFGLLCNQGGVLCWDPQRASNWPSQLIVDAMDSDAFPSVTDSENAEHTLRAS